MILASYALLENVLDAYKFSATKFVEDDGSVTLGLNEIDLIENADSESDAHLALSKSILEYAEDYFREFPLWSAAPNRKGHVPYILKALILDDPEKIGEVNHDMPRWKELKRFCERDGWECYKDTDHFSIVKSMITETCVILKFLRGAERFTAACGRK